MKETGVILKNYLPAKYKVAILNERGERFEALAALPAHIEKLRPGYQISYSLGSGATIAKLVDVEIVAIPKAISYESLQFLHQFIELCLLTIPEGHISIEVVDLLKILLNGNTNDWSVPQRRLLICVLLAVLGFYPELALNEYDLVYTVGEIGKITSVDFFQFKIDVKTDRVLVKWITNFINTNVSPRLAGLFATVYQN